MSKMSIIAVCGILIAGAFLYVGCETGSGTEQIQVSPSTATLHYGQSVQLTASGGYSYTWSLQSSTSGSTVLGTLSSSTGPSVVYTSAINPGSNGVTDVVTVTSVIPGDSSGTNSTSSLTETGQAVITLIE